jgi:hypothetical protein
LTIRTVLGTACDAEVTGPPRVVDLGMEFWDNGAVTMHYDFWGSSTGYAAVWAAWTLSEGVEGSGLAYEGLPCSGAEFEPSGAPTTLTGYFSATGQAFSAIEVRRYMGRAEGEIVYYLEWKAERL